METQTSLYLLWVLCTCCFISSAVAYTNFYVGGEDGWVLSPHESYNHWARKHRFQVNDTLVFKYRKGSDSVLRVNKQDYLDCNTKNPVKTMNSGSSVFKFHRSGHFFFISGREKHCEEGQKLKVLVFGPNQSPPRTPSPESHPPAATPRRQPTYVTPSPSQIPAVSPVWAPSPGYAKSPTSWAPVLVPVPEAPSPKHHIPKHPSPSPSPKAPSPPNAKPPVWVPEPAASPRYPPAPANSPNMAPRPHEKAPASSPVPSSDGSRPPWLHPAPTKAPSATTLPPTPVPALSPKAPSPHHRPPTPKAKSPSSESSPANTPKSSPAVPLTPPPSVSHGFQAPAPAPSASWVITPTVMWVVGSILFSAIAGVSL